LSVVRYIADEVMVMYFGDVVEHGTRDAVFSAPQHEYTRTLFAATPRADVESIKARIARQAALAGRVVPDARPRTWRCGLWPTHTFIDLSTTLPLAGRVGVGVSWAEQTEFGLRPPGSH